MEEVEAEAEAEDSAVCGNQVVTLVVPPGRDADDRLIQLEDLHWADPETTAVVEFLADHLARTRTVCLATVRTGEGSGMERLARRSADRRTATVIDVGPLSDPDVARLTAGCLGADGVPDELLAMVTSSAEGVPLVVEELLATGETYDAAIPKPGGLTWSAMIWSGCSSNTPTRGTAMTSTD